MERMLGYDIVTSPVQVCLERICRWIDGNARGRVFVCANPHSLVTAQKDPLFNAALRAADLVTPDGAGIVLASRLMGGHITDRITGSDVFTGLSRELNRRQGLRPCRYFFLGSNESTLADIQKRMAREFPHIQFAGSFSPPYKTSFSEADNQQMVAAVNAAHPDVLWVGMTAPKQEKWIFQNKDRLNVGFIGAVGAVFDFYSGRVKRSAPAFQRLGLEWLPRLLQEPKRLFKRNFVSSPVFLYHVFSGKYFGCS